MIETNMKEALAYAARGWHVFRIHAISDGRCTCKRDCGKDAGKHPVDAGGFRKATADPSKVRHLFGKSTANVGIATGKASGLLTLDVDPRNGGDESLAKLVAEHGPLPRTPTVATGGGGRQYYFSWPTGREVGKATPWPGLDVLGDGAAVVAVPSMHRSGNRYRWEVSPEEADLAEAPAWIVDAAEAKPRPKAQAGGEGGGRASGSAAREAPPAGSLRGLGHGLRLTVEADAPGLAEAPGVGEGERHGLLLRLAGQALGLGLDPDEVEALALAWNERNDPPLAGSEVCRHVRGLARRHGGKAEARHDDNTLPPAPGGPAPGTPAPANIENMESGESGESMGSGPGDALHARNVLNARNALNREGEGGKADGEGVLSCSHALNARNALNGPGDHSGGEGCVVVIPPPPLRQEAPAADNYCVMLPKVAESAVAVADATAEGPAQAQADAEGWPVLHADALHGLAGAIVEAIGPETEADPVGVLLSLLAGFGNAAGRGPHFTAGADRHGCNLSVCLVGGTASGKGQSLGLAKYLLAKADPRWAATCIVNGLSSGEGLVDRLRDAEAEVEAEGPRLRLSQAGAVDKRLLCVESEFARLLAVGRREGNTLSAILRQAWDGGTLEVLCRGKGHLVATDAHVGIVGHITPEELEERLGKGTEVANGFANRFLWALVRRSNRLPHGGNAGVLDRFARPLEEALAHAREGRRLAKTAEADALWEAEYDNLSRERGGAWGMASERARPQAMRLALLYAVLDRADAIGERHLRAALALWAYCDESARHLFGGKGKAKGKAGHDNNPPPSLPPKARLGMALADAIAKSPGISRRGLHEATHGHVKADAMTEALAWVSAMGMAHAVGGRWYPGPGPGDDDEAASGASGESVANSESVESIESGANIESIASIESKPAAGADARNALNALNALNGPTHEAGAVPVDEAEAPAGGKVVQAAYDGGGGVGVAGMASAEALSNADWALLEDDFLALQRMYIL